MDVSGSFCNTPRHQLRTLLDSVVEAARSDTHDYSGGHLNEANLYKPPEVANHKTWKSAKKPRVQLMTSIKPSPSDRKVPRRERMKDTMVNFSLGTVGTIPMPNQRKSETVRTKTKSPRGPTYAGASSSSGARDSGDVRFSLRESTSGQGSVTQEPTESSSRERGRESGYRPLTTDTYAERDDGILVEELRLPELMLRRPAPPGISGELRRSPPQEDERHDFTGSYMAGITMKDQFERKKRFESDVIGKQDTVARHVMQGYGAVGHLEQKLRHGLRGLLQDGHGPNFHRLQVFSGTFEDVVEESKTFGFILRTIKREYDSYVASLLDAPTGQHRVLYDQVRQLASHPSSSPEIVTMEQERVQRLEQEARDMLEENERLRQELRDEMNRPVEPEPEPRNVLVVRSEGEVPQDIVETVEALRAGLLEKLDAVQALRALLRKEYVPSTVCTHLEQCIKETEVEIQRLMSNKTYFESNIMDMEKDLQEAIESADTTERDQRRVWKRISAVKAGSGQGRALDSDDEQDDSSKWDWYIS